MDQLESKVLQIIIKKRCLYQLLPKLLTLLKSYT